MSLSLVTAPTVEPVSLAEVKNYLKIDDDLTEDDALLSGLIAVARQHLDGYSGVLGRCLVSQTWKLSLPDFKSVIKLPLPPLQSVTHVKYYDTGGNLDTVSASIYEVITGGTSGGYIHLLGDQTWPTDVDTDRAEPVEITFVAGYGDSWNDVPEPLRLAICGLVAHWHLNREPVGESMGLIPMHINSLIDQYRVKHAW